MLSLTRRCCISCWSTQQGFSASPRRLFACTSSSWSVSSTTAQFAANNVNDRNTEATTKYGDGTAGLLFPSYKAHHSCRPPPPYLAVITEPDACDSDDNVKRTYTAIAQAVANGEVDLVSIRQAKPAISDLDTEEDKEQTHAAILRRLVQLAKQLLELSTQFPFTLVVSSDWVDVLSHVPGIHGIHVKESHREDIIPFLRQSYPNGIIGTSAHSLESAMKAYDKYQPDYFFVGTCYVTQTHPEKTADDLEGPSLPGRIAKALADQAPDRRPAVFAIGGIHAENCHEPVKEYGADGVATIRAVLHSSDPAETVRKMKANMKAED